MDSEYTLGVGVYSLGGVAGHIVIGVTDSDNRVIAEFNGLATGPDGNPRTMGFPWQFNDTIQAYPGITPMYAGAAYRIELGRYTFDEYLAIEQKIYATIAVINSQNLGYHMMSQNSNSVARTILEAIGLAPSVGQLNRLAIPGYNNILADPDFLEDINQECFPAHTPIAISLTETRPISDIRVGDTVLAFDPAADLGRGALVPRKVVRLYRNTTDEWVKLTWRECGEQKELVTTPGHHFLDSFGDFPTIEEMLENGRATVVRASGELTEVTAERIVYSAETAHLFERGEQKAMLAGNAALPLAA